MELGSWLRLLICWSWLFVLSVLVAVLVSYQLRLSTPVEYEASARVLVGPGLNGAKVSADLLRASSMLVNSYRDYASTRAVLDQAIEELGLQTTPSDLASRVTTTANVDNRMIEVRVRDSSPSRAAAIATKLVEVMARNPNLTEPAPAAQVTPYDLPTMGQQIKGRTQQMMLPATLVALVLSVLVMLTVEFGKRLVGWDAVGTGEELAAAAGACLGVLPVTRGGPPASPEHLLLRVAPAAPEADCYRLVGARLLTAVEQARVRSLLICTVAGDTDSAEVAANLAAAVAERVGRIVLVDAALKHPRFGSLFATAGVRGLTDLLAGKSAGPLPSVPWMPGLTVVPAGAAVAACGQLLNSAQMATLIRALSERVELLILRTSSVQAATDALLLAGQVDAVLLIARRGATSQKALGQACRDIEIAGGRMIGGILVQPVRFPKPEARPRPRRSLSAVDGSAIIGEPTE